MAQINEVRRSVPPMPDPRDTDQARINRMTIEVIKYLLSKLDQLSLEERLSALEERVKGHDEILNG